MRIGIHVGQYLQYDDVAEARLIEDVGLDAAWLGDGIWSPGGRDGTIAAAVLLQATSAITVGINVLGAAIHRPQSIARSAATIESYFPGRFVLGLGAGYHKRFEAQAAWGFPARDDAGRIGYFAETLEYLQRYFRDEYVTFEGEHLTVRNARGAPFLRGQRPPILIGGSRGAIMPLVARYADLWDGMAIWRLGAREGEDHRAYFLRKREELAKECAAIGRDPAAIRLCLTIYATLARTVEEAEAITADVLDTIPARPAVAGTPDELVAALVTAGELGVTEAQILPVTRGRPDERMEVIRVIGEEVAPTVRASLARSSL